MGLDSLGPKRYIWGMTTGHVQIDISGWDEQTVTEHGGGGKFTVASVQQTLTGDIEGTSDVRWVMAYTAPTEATYVGMQTVEGTLGGRQGTFILRSIGTFTGGVAAADLDIVADSATDGLVGLTGSGRMHGPMAEIDLDYELPALPKING